MTHPWGFGCATCWGRRPSRFWPPRAGTSSSSPGPAGGRHRGPPGTPWSRRVWRRPPMSPGGPPPLPGPTRNNPRPRPSCPPSSASAAEGRNPSPYPARVSFPRVVAVAPGSPAAEAGLQPGDEIVSVAGRRPRDVIEWRLLVDDPDLDLEVRRGGLDADVAAPKRAGQPLGAEGASA